jgi:hypothetical protein
LQITFHSMMNYRSTGRTGMTFDCSARSYFARNVLRGLKAQISWCLIN